jgi:hypothetical protein
VVSYYLRVHESKVLILWIDEACTGFRSFGGGDTFEYIENRLEWILSVNRKTVVDDGYRYDVNCNTVRLQLQIHGEFLCTSKYWIVSEVYTWVIKNILPQLKARLLLMR